MYGKDTVSAARNEFHHELKGNEHLEQIAAGCGCHTARVDTHEALAQAVREGMAQVRKGRCAVINAIMEQP